MTSKLAHTIRNVLHVDDDPDMLQLVSKYLQKSFNVHSISSPKQAVDHLVSSGCRLVILDIQMGEHNGLDLLRTIKQLDGGILVVMLTGLVSIESVLVSMREGAEACLFKPLREPQELVETMEQCAAKALRWHRTVNELLSRRAVENSRMRRTTAGNAAAPLIDSPLLCEQFVH
jgi:DNA-binding NtrC family response regulator